MATKTWIGGTGNFENSLAWTPTGVPVSGDVAVIGPGSAASPTLVQVSNTLIDGVTIRLSDTAPGTSSISPFVPTLNLQNVSLSSTTTIENPPYPPNVLGGTGTIDLKGRVLNAGQILSGHSLDNFALHMNMNGSAFVNSGTLRAGWESSIDLSGNGVVINNGNIGTDGADSHLKIGAPVIGRGTFDLSGGFFPFSRDWVDGTTEFTSLVGGHETVTLTGEHLLLDRPLTFLATIDDTLIAPPGPLSRNSSITLVREQATSETFGNGVLTVLNGHELLARLHFSGTLEASDFVLTNGAQGAVITI
jgi:hypothetical protein